MSGFKVVSQKYSKWAFSRLLHTTWNSLLFEGIRREVESLIGSSVSYKCTWVEIPIIWDEPSICRGLIRFDSLYLDPFRQRRLSARKLHRGWKNIQLVIFIQVEIRDNLRQSVWDLLPLEENRISCIIRP